MPWDRDAVAYCSSTALQYIHMRWPCQNCNGKVVTRSTELRHRKAAKLISNCSMHAHVEDISDNNMEGTNDDNMEGINNSGMECRVPLGVRSFVTLVFMNLLVTDLMNINIQNILNNAHYL